MSFGGRWFLEVVGLLEREREREREVGCLYYLIRLYVKIGNVI